ncbi:MAG: SlyX family protein [Pedosphaera sp.]|nr:SlyX family protein [Pedosphaera sp.]
MSESHDQKLETQIAFLEHTVEQLNAVVVEQGKQMAKLHAQVRKLTDSVEAQELERIRATNPKPPHY